MRQDYPPARADIERAKQLRASSEVSTLAGIIEYNQDDLDPSEKDLRIAISMPGGGQQCTAHWYLGLVGIKRKTWIPAGTAFERAMNCYETDAALAAESLAKMEARTDIDPDFKTRQIEGFKAALAESRTQQYAGAFNAANYYATGGDLVKARVLLDVAAKDASLAEKVSKLRDYLKDK